MIDFHSHILHKFDDGSHNVEESIAMLRESHRQGVDTIVSTSHYRLGEHKIETFLKERRKRMDEIKAALSDEDKASIPRITLGAEIEYIPGMHNWDYLPQLAISGTNYIMLEMPFMPWTEAMLNTVEHICTHTNLTPIIPHIDRYFILIIKPEYYQRLYEMPVIIQLNAIFVNNPNNSARVRDLFDKNIVHILGSDCHSAEWRPPNLGRTQNVLNDICGRDVLREIDARGRRMLENAIFEDIS